MFEIKIIGPDYELIGASFQYEIQISGTPVPTGTRTIHWYKNNTLLSDFDNEFILPLMNAEGPAAGVYRAECVFSEEDVTYKSNSIYLDMGEVPKDIPATVDNLSPVITFDVGDKIKISAPVVHCDDTNIEVIYSWYKDDEFLYWQNSMVIPDATESNAGNYKCVTEVTKKGAYNDVIKTSEFKLALKEDDFNSIYIHDLRPARNAGFIVVGWWILDEINNALKEGFDWTKNPTDERFKYKDYMKALSDGFVKWADLEVQGTRNGYILGRANLIDGEKIIR